MCLNKLRDLGCEVASVQGVMFYVKYLCEDLKIEYLYYINPDNTYYLERIKPYVVAAGDLKSEEEVVNAIKIDIEQFRNAKQSKNFNSFIDVDIELSKAVRTFEDLYLYYNISKEDTELIKAEIGNIMSLLKEVKNKSTRVFLEKDPETLEDL